MASRINTADVKKKYESAHPGTIQHVFEKQGKKKTAGGKDKTSTRLRGSQGSKKSKQLHGSPPMWRSTRRKWQRKWTKQQAKC